MDLPNEKSVCVAHYVHPSFGEVWEENFSDEFEVCLLEEPRISCESQLKLEEIDKLFRDAFCTPYLFCKHFS